MNVSPFATKARVSRLEDRVAELEAQVEEILACLDRLNFEVGFTVGTVSKLKRHVEAREAAADFDPGPRPDPPAWH